MHFHEAANAERLSQGRPPRIALPAKLTDPEDDEPPELVDVVVVNGYKQAWGFLIFRTDYKNEVAWQTFENKFNMLVTTSLKIGKPGKPGEPIVGRDYQRIASGKTIKVITSPSLQGASVLDVIR